MESTASPPASAGWSAAPAFRADPDARTSSARMQRTRRSPSSGRRSGSFSRQASITNSQRGAKWHPWGREPGEGARPGIPTSRLAPDRCGIAAVSRRVYGWAASWKSSWTRPSSTMRPAYMTATRSARVPTTARSWLT